MGVIWTEKRQNILGKGDLSRWLGVFKENHVFGRKKSYLYVGKGEGAWERHHSGVLGQTGRSRKRWILSSQKGAMKGLKRGNGMAENMFLFIVKQVNKLDFVGEK